MDTIITTQMPMDSGIAAFGTAKSSFNKKGVLIGLIAVVLLALCGYGAWYFFSRPLQIPEQTALLVEISPRLANKIRASSDVDHLPLVWRAALRPASSLPIILGAYRTPSGWHEFSLTPIWFEETKNTFSQSHGFVRLTSDQPLPPKTKTFSFLEPWQKWKSALWSDATAWINTSAFFTNDADQETAILAEPFTVAYSHGILSTTLAAESMTNAPALKDADISLNVGLATTLSFLSTLGDHLQVDGLSQTLLRTTPSQINIRWNGSNRIETESLIFNQPLTEAEAGAGLSALGIHQNTVQTLADGSIYLEEMTIPQGSSTIFGKTSSPRFSAITLSPNELIFGNATETEGFDDAAPSKNCQNKDANPIARLSSAAISLFLQDIGINWSNVPTVQLFSDNGMLKVCTE